MYRRKATSRRMGQLVTEPVPLSTRLALTIGHPAQALPLVWPSRPLSWLLGNVLLVLAAVQETAKAGSCRSILWV